jgi:glycosyltransferase involved in cell wall biosynthesis
VTRELRSHKASTHSPDVPLVCVVMPAYLSAETLLRAADSVLNQTYRRLILAVAIRPADRETRAVAEALMDDRVRIVDAGVGIPHARNDALRAVAADLYMFLDSDDAYAANDVIARYVDDVQLEPTPALRYADWMALSPVGGAPTLRRMPTPRRWQHPRLLLENFVATGTVMVPASILSDVGFFDQRYSFAEDWDLWLRIAHRYPLRHMQVTAYVYTRTKLKRIFGRGHFAPEFEIIASQSSPRGVRVLAATIARGRYAAYYVRTLHQRKGSELLDIRPLDLMALPLAIGFRLIRYHAVVL